MRIYFLTIFLVFVLVVCAQYFSDANAYIKIKNKKKFSISSIFIGLTCILLIIVAGFRWKVGADYGAYAFGYAYYKEDLWRSILEFDEPGIRILANLSKLIYDDYATLLFLCSFLTIFLMIMTFIKYNNRLYLVSILLFIFIGVWHGTFNGVRQYLACAFIFTGHRYIIEKKLIHFLFVIFLASLFHISSISMVILYFVPLQKISLKHIFILLICVLSLVYSYDFVFNILGRVKGDEIVTLSPYMLRTVNRLRIGVTLAPILTYFFFSKKEKLLKEDYFYLNTMFINAGIMLATANSAYLARLGIYTSLYYTISFPKLLNMNDKYLKYLLISFIIMFFAFYWYIDVFDDYTLNKFQWVFNRTNYYIK